MKQLFAVAMFHNPQNMRIRHEQEVTIIVSHWPVSRAPKPPKPQSPQKGQVSNYDR